MEALKKHQGECDSASPLFHLFEKLCSLTKLKIHVLLSALFPGPAHVIRMRLQAWHLEELFLRSLASIVSEVNSFDRCLDGGNVQLFYLGRTQQYSISCGNGCVGVSPCVFFFSFPLSWRQHNQQELITKLSCISTSLSPSLSFIYVEQNTLIRAR